LASLQALSRRLSRPGILRSDSPAVGKWKTVAVASSTANRERVFDFGRPISYEWLMEYLAWPASVLILGLVASLFSGARSSGFISRIKKDRQNGHNRDG